MTDTRIDADAWHDRIRTIYSSGDPLYLARLQEPIANELVALAKIEPGHRVLDIGAGSGSVAIAAAKLGATVSAIDLTPKQVDLGKARSNSERVDINWIVGDAEALPFEPQSFDIVLSNFGVIFAANPSHAATEIQRVLAHQGRALFTAWPDYSFNGQVAKLVKRMLPPDERANIVDDEAWADVEHLHNWFTPRVPRIDRHTDTSQRFPSVDAWWDSTQQVPLVQYLRSVLDADAFAEYKRTVIELATKFADFDAQGVMTRRMDYVIGHIH